MVFRMNYTKLTNNLIDLVKEEQAKLGYRKEAIRLYYPLSSLQHILGTTDSAEQLTEKLQKEADFAKDSLGTLDISCQMTGSALVFLPLDLNGYTIICSRQNLSYLSWILSVVMAVQWKISLHYFMHRINLLKYRKLKTENLTIASAF